MGYKSDRDSRGKTSQTEWLFESNLKSFGYFKCSTVLWLLLDPRCKGNMLTRVGWALQAQIVNWCPNRVFEKNGSCMQILDMTLMEHDNYSCFYQFFNFWRNVTDLPCFSSISFHFCPSFLHIQQPYFGIRPWFFSRDFKAKFRQLTSKRCKLT